MVIPSCKTAALNAGLGKDEINQNKTYLNYYSIQECLDIAGKYSEKAINSLNIFNALTIIY